MRRAIELAGRVDLGHDVNPRVGAVVVAADGTVLGEGWHEGAGSPHAEVIALRNAGARAAGATVYTTLEPCAASGRVGPCTDALIRAGVSRVVYGQADPNPAMAGGGERLAAAGVHVEAGVLAVECEALNPSWTFAHRTDRPWVVWKTATSVDGFVAPPDGASKWITGEPAREHVQRLRAGVGAVVTGTGTVFADDPRLTVRGQDRQPLRVVVGTRELPAQAAVHPAVQYRVPVAQALTALWREHRSHRVLVEAGPRLSTALWLQGLVDEVYWFQAPVVLGRGVPVLDMPFRQEPLRFPEVALHRVGLDVLYHFLTR